MYIGQCVHWYRNADASSTPLPALVTQLEPGNCLQLTIFPGISKHFDVKLGVPHVSDPYLENNVEAASRAGAWDFIPDPLEAELKQLRKDFEALKADLYAPTKGSKAK
jgi:hypothetical protein